MRELGEAEARRVAETMGILEDPVLSGYVRAVGERLARFSPRTDVAYTFQIVDMEEPNAFAREWRRGESNRPAEDSGGRRSKLYRDLSWGCLPPTTLHYRQLVPEGQPRASASKPRTHC